MAARETGPQIGDPCPRSTCDGVLRVYSCLVQQTAGVRVRYLHCGACKCRPVENKQVVPLRYAPGRVG